MHCQPLHKRQPGARLALVLLLAGMALMRCTLAAYHALHSGGTYHAMVLQH